MQCTGKKKIVCWAYEYNRDRFWEEGGYCTGLQPCQCTKKPIFEYNQRLYSLGRLAGNDQGFEHSICASRGHAASKRH